MVSTARFGIPKFDLLRTFFFLLAIAAVSIGTGCGGGSSSKNNNNGGSGSLAAVNHIVFMLQENRSFDNYFGKLK